MRYYSFQTVCGIINVPHKWCETGPRVYRPYLRRLETICRCHYKGSIVNLNLNVTISVFRLFMRSWRNTSVILMELDIYQDLGWKKCIPMDELRIARTSNSLRSRWSNTSLPKGSELQMMYIPEENTKDLVIIYWVAMLRSEKHTT